MSLCGEFRKSSASFSNSNCLEARWKKASFSTASSCVEARWQGQVEVRDSQLGDASPVLSFSGAEWDKFLTVLEDVL